MNIGLGVELLKIESQVLKKTVLRITEPNNFDWFYRNEDSILKALHPFYIQILIKSSEISTIHNYEGLGFKFVEFRIKRIVNLANFEFSTKSHYPLEGRIITDSSEQGKACSILQADNSDDRFSVDPCISKNLAIVRLKEYLKKAFTNYPCEFVFGLFNNVNRNELLAFRSGKKESSNEVELNLTCIKKNVGSSNYYELLELFTLKYLKENGIQFVRSISTGFNIKELNISLTKVNYQIDSTWVMLRKIYN